jgi:hypothetical protein
LRSTLIPSFSVAIVSADALTVTAPNRRRLGAVPDALLGKEQKLRRPVLRSWTGVATIGLVISPEQLTRTWVGPRAWYIERSVAQVSPRPGPLVAYLSCPSFSHGAGAFCSTHFFIFLRSCFAGEARLELERVVASGVVLGIWAVFSGSTSTGSKIGAVGNQKCLTDGLTLRPDGPRWWRGRSARVQNQLDFLVSREICYLKLWD